MMGSSTDPQVSAAQCTNPDPKSAVTIPQKAATRMVLNFSSLIWHKMNTKFTAVSVRQMPTHMHSWVLFPKTGKSTFNI